ncbi:MAG: hypothetical protein WCJ56_02735 [bacterium]
MKNLLLLLILTVSLASAALANDMRISGVGGTIRRMDGEDANIRMESEWVNVDVYEKTYDVTATFNFINDSDEEQTVKMGFPEDGGGDGSNTESGFTSFSSNIDGIYVDIQRSLISTKDRDETRYQAYYVKEVTFQPRQARLVQVNYTSLMGDVSSPPYHFVEYGFTGGNWKGKVSSSEILYTIKGTGSWQISSYTKFSQNGNELYYQWKNWEAEKECEIFLSQVVPNTLVPGNQDTKKNIYNVSNPGVPGKIEYDLYGFVRGNVVYGNLDRICRELNGEKIFSRKRAAKVDWVSEAGFVKLHVGKSVFSFKPNSNVMKVSLPVNADGKITMQDSAVELPGEAMLIGSKMSAPDESMYVPIAPLVKALNGTYKLIENRSALEMAFTKEGLADFVTETVAPAPPVVVPSAIPVNPGAKVPATSAQANALPMNLLAGLGALLVVLLAGYLLRRRKTVA